MSNHWFIKILFSVLTFFFVLPAHALTFELPESGNVVGNVFTTTTVYEDTFLDVARKYDVAYDELVAANPGVDPWIPGEGTKVVIPARYVLPPGAHQGIVINLAERLLYYFPKNKQQVMIFPIAIGLEATPTPITVGKVTEKEPNPIWYVPNSIYQRHLAEGNPVPHVVYPGPDNPLGKFALHLSIPGYLIHGTNKWVSVGQRMSNGCIRLYPEDIARLFHIITVGEPVRIINQPYKIGFDNKGNVYFEAHPLMPESRSLVEAAGPINYATNIIDKQQQAQSFDVNWHAVKQTLAQSNGIPKVIGQTGVVLSQE